MKLEMSSNNTRQFLQNLQKFVVHRETILVLLLEEGITYFDVYISIFYCILFLFYFFLSFFYFEFPFFISLFLTFIVLHFHFVLSSFLYLLRLFISSLFYSEAYARGGLPGLNHLLLNLKKLHIHFSIFYTNRFRFSPVSNFSLSE